MPAQAHDPAAGTVRVDRPIAALGLLPISAAVAAAPADTEVAMPAQTRILRDLAYGPEPAQRLDVYLPVDLTHLDVNATLGQASTYTSGVDAFLRSAGMP